MCDSILREYKKLLKNYVTEIQLLDGKKIPFTKSISGFELVKKLVSHLKNLL